MTPLERADLIRVQEGDVDDVPLNRLYSLTAAGLLETDEVPNYGAVFVLSDAGRAALEEG
jgi:hypothetical protein